jgi:hypothetical protein
MTAAAARGRGRLRRRAALAVLSRAGALEQSQTPALSSARQAACLNPARVSSAPPSPGPAAGVVLTGGQRWQHSIHGLKRAGEISGLNAVVLGGYGSGKSSLAKDCYGLLGLGEGCRLAVFDRKRQRSAAGDDSGEYKKLAEFVGGQRVVFDRRPGRGARINLLDPAIQPTGAEDTLVGQDELLLLAAEAALGRRLTDTGPASSPAHALRAAHRAALRRAAQAGRPAELGDVIDALYRPDRDGIPGPVGPDGRKVLEASGIFTLEDLVRSGLPVALALEKYVDGELSGLIDGPTRDADGGPLDLSNRLLVFDTSGLTEGSAALGFVVTVASVFVQAKWASHPENKYLVLEEAYFNDALERVPELLRQVAKRGRGSGTAVLTLVHHLSDIPAGSPMMALIREADVVHVFRQDKADDADQVIGLLDLPAGLRPIIMDLPEGCHVLRVTGRPPVVVQHLRSPQAQQLTFTDEAVMLTGLAPAAGGPA